MMMARSHPSACVQIYTFPGGCLQSWAMNYCKRVEMLESGHLEASGSAAFCCRPDHTAFDGRQIIGRSAMRWPAAVRVCS